MRVQSNDLVITFVTHSSKHIRAVDFTNNSIFQKMQQESKSTTTGRKTLVFSFITFCWSIQSMIFHEVKS